MIESKDLQSALDRAWRLSGESPVADELAVIQGAQLARIADALERIAEQVPQRLRHIELTIDQRDLP